jgi:SAM-dependent methyltransferase
MTGASIVGTHGGTAWFTGAVDERLENNRNLWNEYALLHEDSEFYGLAAFLEDAERIEIRDFEREAVGDVAGKSLLHLQCHFGMDTLSWARLGARVTGVDFSPRAIEIAQRVAADAGIRGARFVCANVLELDSVLDERFDVVYTSRGVLIWLPDLTRWAQVVARSLKPDGIFYIHEGHPMATVWDDEAPVSEGPRLRYPYFESDRPFTWSTEGEGTYAVPDATIQTPVSYEWAHSIGEIVTSLVDAGLEIEFLHEFDHAFWQAFPYLVEGDDGLFRLPADAQGSIPLSFELKARKPAAG